MNKENLTVANCNSLTDLLLLLRKTTMERLHVSTLAFYYETIKKYSQNDGYGIINAKPFPLEKNQTSYSINVYYFEDREFKENEILQVIYTDMDFTTTLNTSVKIPLVNASDDRHTQKSAFLVGSGSNSSPKYYEHYIKGTSENLSANLKVVSTKSTPYTSQELFDMAAEGIGSFYENGCTYVGYNKSSLALCINRIAMYGFSFVYLAGSSISAFSIEFDPSKENIDIITEL